jgi:ATP-dependent Clp protease ATP-binding subunit ClpC
VLLLDEVEKAHPEVFNVLLQLLDDGRLTDGQGRTVSFTNVVVIMTSNIPGEPLDFFRPEFVNRIDEIIVFHRLSPEELRQITELLLEDTRRRLHGQNVELDLTPAAVSWLAEHGYEPEYGARPMRRLIQREIDNRLSEMLLRGEVAPGDKVRADVHDGRLAFEVVRAEVPPAAL